MNEEKPYLHSTLFNKQTREVRHLIILFLNGNAETKLIQLSGGTETSLATGTRYETGEKANELLRQWIADDGFERASEKNLAFEPLKSVVALAAMLGFKVVYDNSYKKPDKWSLNLTGAVPLSQWPGLTAKLGGGYEYAFDYSKLEARPTLPPNVNIGSAPSDPQKLAAFFLEVMKLQDAVGPRGTFLLAGD